MQSVTENQKDDSTVSKGERKMKFSFLSPLYFTADLPSRDSVLQNRGEKEQDRDTAWLAANRSPEKATDKPGGIMAIALKKQQRMEKTN